MIRRLSSTGDGVLSVALSPSLALTSMPLRRFVVLSLVALIPMAGCGTPESKAEVGVTAAPAAVLPPFQQELASMKAEVTLPGAWKYGYRLIDRADTTFGGHQAVEFHYTADSASGVPPRLLMVIRAFKKPMWEKVRDSQGNIAKVLAEHDGQVYTYSIVTKSPYPVGTASTLRVDQMMMGLIAETSPFRMTFKK
ncbi:MAG: hypothetical protein ACYC3F_07640 [Gemmatimonadaceae bacterium]